MIDVGAHESGGCARRHDAMHEEDDGRGIRAGAADAVEAVSSVDVVPLRGEARGDRVTMAVGHILGALDRDKATGRGVRHECSADARQEP